MKYKWAKAVVCAIAAAILITGAGFQTKAARGVMASLPAAGLGLTMEDGSSVATIRNEVKQKKAQQQETTQQSDAAQISANAAVSGSEGSETVAAQNTQETTAQTLETENVNAAVDTQNAADNGQNTAADAAGTAKILGSTAEEETLMDASEEYLTTVSSDADTVSQIDIVWAVQPRVREAKTQLTEEETQEPDLIIAQVNSYVNIRSTPSTEGEVVGKLYDNSVGTLIAEADGWYQIKSGSVEGYVKAEYFKTGAEAKQIADEVGDKIATVTAQTLRVRTEPSLEATILGLVPGGDQLTVLETAEGFVKVSIEEGDGWVSTDYVDVAVEYVTAESREEEAARLAAEEEAREEARRAAEAAEAKLREQEEARAREAQAKAEAEAQRAAEAAAQQAAAQQSAEAAQTAKETQSASAVAASASSLGQAVANYAVQFVGNPYVYGGTSLTNGADCSGFVMSVYRNFGVSLPHSSYSDRFVGYKVNSMAEAQPGDIICYSGHVAIYIGNGQIVHASTKKTGIKISDATYRTPLAIRRIF